MDYVNAPSIGTEDFQGIVNRICGGTEYIEKTGRTSMKISTRGRYALRLMIELAMNQDGDPVRIKDVAVRQDISAKYLEQIVSVLVKARYVRSIRGPQGGYRLTRKPEEYCVGDIIRLLSLIHI